MSYVLNAPQHAAFSSVPAPIHLTCPSLTLFPFCNSMFPLVNLQLGMICGPDMHNHSHPVYSKGDTTANKKMGPTTNEHPQDARRHWVHMKGDSTVHRNIEYLVHSHSEYSKMPGWRWNISSPTEWKQENRSNYLSLEMINGRKYLTPLLQPLSITRSPWGLYNNCPQPDALGLNLSVCLSVCLSLSVSLIYSSFLPSFLSFSLHYCSVILQQSVRKPGAK